ncbi:FAD-binding oxidoreductase [Thermosulfurimonas sp. F29]|uniref:FAD-binding oxidoreductase n=1 Tax=Thermosulfurimonas sp. F29 TaxID=2867247 RepID=UPI001C837B71|nr:FAD-linked oxidase C-terminal domain-containing protein [Thermosulfurimonas sp. F29]MBX6423977.1 FAD-binding protein [Thermosulfurimonas sp. F29]
MKRRLSRAARRALRRLLRDRFLEEEAACLAYAYDASGLIRVPEAVALPENTEEVSRILTLSYEEEFPVTPRGAGTATTGAPLAPEGGLVLCLSRMNRILEINPEDLVAVVEPGVVNARLKEALARRGLFYPPDPASFRFSTIGGNVATCAGGPRGLKYGVTRDYVLGLEAVLPGGEVLSLGVRTLKGVVGYDLTRLLVGSEGTLAVFTRITLKVLPLPPSRGTLAAGFTDEESALSAMQEVLSRGVLPAAAEFMDRVTLSATGFPEREVHGLLLFEFDGPEAAVKEDLERTRHLLAGKTRFLKEARGAEAEGLWEIRRGISPALRKLGARRFADDVVLPRSRLSFFLKEVRRLSAETGLTVACFGHAGDGNLHVNILFEPEAEPRARTLREKILSLVLELSGTLSGEHGVGLTKKAYLPAEVPPAGLSLMRELKRLFDPKGLLNPEKVL